jgi:hypothetical protein
MTMFGFRMPDIAQSRSRNKHRSPSTGLGAPMESAHEEQHLVPDYEVS